MELARGEAASGHGTDKLLPAVFGGSPNDVRAGSFYVIAVDKIELVGVGDSVQKLFTAAVAPEVDIVPAHVRHFKAPREVKLFV